jgi:hypothetical protein
MKCAEFEDRLNEVLDQRQRPEWHSELRLHFDSCARCRDLTAAYGLLLDGFHALPRPEPPADLSERVLDAYRAQPSMTRPVVMAGGLLAAAAAVLLLVVPLATSNRRVRSVSPPIQPLALESSRAISWPLDLSEMYSLPFVGPVLVSITDGDASTDPYEELAKGTGQGLASVVLYMPSIGVTPGLVVGSPNPLTSGPPGWPQRMSAGLRPVTEVVSETLDLLLQVLPNNESQS